MSVYPYAYEGMVSVDVLALLQKGTIQHVWVAYALSGVKADVYCNDRGHVYSSWRAGPRWNSTTRLRAGIMLS